MVPVRTNRSQHETLGILPDAGGRGSEILDDAEEREDLILGEETVGLAEKREGFGEEGEDAVDGDDAFDGGVVEAAADAVGGALRHGDEGLGRFAFAVERAESGGRVRGEVLVAEVVEAAYGCVAGEGLGEEGCGVGIFSRESDER